MSTLAVGAHIADRGRKNDARSHASLEQFGRDLYINISTNTAYSKFQRMYRNDRIAFLYDCMPSLRNSIAPYQIEILGKFDMGVRRIAVRAPHGVGKTLVAAILVHHAILTTEEDCKVPTTASAWRQLEKYLWPEIHKVARLLDWDAIGRVPYGRDELLTLSLKSNGGSSEAFAVASDDAATIEGAHATRLVYIFDEAKTIGASTWDAAEGAFSTEGVEMLHGTQSECIWFAISTPGAPNGRFYDIHARRPGYEDWDVRHITLDEAIDAGRLSAEWALQRAKQWGETSAIYQNRVLGEFATQEESSVIPLAWVEAAIERYEMWEDAGKPPLVGRKVLGVDTARMGSDSTVLAERVGNGIVSIHKYMRQPTTATAGYVKALGVGYKKHIEMDGGLGASVYDMLREDTEVNGLVPIVMGGKTYARDKTGTFRFADTRSAAWWHLRELLDPDTGIDIMLPRDDELIGDLTAPRFEILQNAVIRLESKKSIRNRIGRSTNCGDAVVLAFWESQRRGGGVVF